MPLNRLQIAPYALDMGFFDWLSGKREVQPSAHNPAGPIVLVVRATDDSLAQALAHRGRPVIAFVHDAPRLVEQIAATGPACVVVEVESAGANGFVVTKWLKSHGGLRTVPLILFSSQVDQGTFNQHMKLRTRADTYVTSSAPAEIELALSPFVTPAV
jgi:DNA-binding NarL/FixJ family response regulator